MKGNILKFGLEFSMVYLPLQKKTQKPGQDKTFGGDDNMFIGLISVMVSQVCAYIQIHHTVY